MSNEQAVFLRGSVTDEADDEDEDEEEEDDDADELDDSSQSAGSRGGIFNDDMTASVTNNKFQMTMR